MVADAAGLGGTEQQQVQIPKREKRPPQDSVRDSPPRPPGKPQLDVLDDKDQKGRRGAGAPTFGNHFHPAGHQLQPIRREPAIVPGILMKRVTEGSHQMSVAAGGENALDLPHDALGVADMFENRVALDALKQAVRKRQALRIGGHIHAGHGEQVQVHVAFHHASGAADIEIPAPQRKVFRLGRVHHQRRRRFEEPAQTVAPMPRSPLAIDRFERSPGGPRPGGPGHRVTGVHRVATF